MNKESNDYKLLLKIKAGDKKAFNEFYLQNEPLVYSLLKKYSHKTNDYEELTMCAKYGLVMAIYRFDLNQDVLFSTYAVPLILGEIKGYFKNKNILKVPRKIVDINKKIDQVNKIFMDKYSRSPTLEEMSLLTHETKENIIEASSSLLKIDYLDEEIYQDTKKVDLVSYQGLSLMDQVDLNLALEKLDKKEQLIIRLRYYDGLTQSEVSQRLNISQVQISRIESKTLQKLKEMLV